MVTLKDIARIAGINVSTVSKALRNSSDIKRDTVAKIKKIAADIGYEIKEELENGSRLIGVICPEIRSNYYSKLVCSIEEEAKKNGYTIVIGFTNFNRKNEEYYLEHFSNAKARGIIFISENQTLNEILGRYIVNNDIPLVIIASNAETLNFDYIMIDDDKGVRLVLDHLVTLGHRDICYIGDRLCSTRLAVFKTVMQEYQIKLPEPWIKVSNERFEECGYKMMNEVFKNEKIPTAVFGAYDDITIGAMKAIYERNLSIPGDISIAGIDDIYISQFMYPELTTVSAPICELAEIAIAILFKKINNRSYKVYQTVKIAPDLIVRKSTRAIP